MRWLTTLLVRLHALFRRDAILDEIREEMDFHLEMRAQDYARRGHTRDQARREAVHRFGNVSLLQDKGYDIRGGGVMESIWQDIRYGVRALRQSPTFTAAAVTVLALAIGVGTAIFSVVDAVVVRGLPYDEQDRIAAVLQMGTFSTSGTTPQTYLDWRRLQESFDALAMVGRTTFQLKNAKGEPDEVRAQRVTWEFFPVLRAKPLLGRLFTSDDEIEGQAQVVILSYGFWQRQFGGTVDIVGQRFELNNQSWQVVGVMPREFTYPPSADRPTELYVPQLFRNEDRVRAQSYNYTPVIGRLKPGLSFARAEEHMNRVAAALNQQYPNWERGSSVHVEPLHEQLVGETRRWMLLLLGSVAFVLLIACANVANLMLARATARAREIAVRNALGASRGRIVRALLIESLILSLTAALIGIGLAFVGVQGLRAWLPADVPRVSAIAVDARVLATTIAASLLTGLLFGVASAGQSFNPDLTRDLRDGDRGSTSNPRSRRLRSVLVVAEVAIAVVLLVGAGLFLGSFVKLMRVEPGFDYHNVLTVRVSVKRSPAESIEGAEARSDAYVRQVIGAVRQVPGVLDVAAVNGGLPLTGSYSRTPVILPNGAEWKKDDAVDLKRVAGGYFTVLRIPLRRGRLLSDEDRVGAPLVAMVNETAAAKYWSNQNPLGQHLVVNGKDREVVGIVGDIRHYGPEKPPRQAVFVPFTQDRNVSADLLVRTSENSKTLLPAVKTAIWSINPDQLLAADIVTLEGYMDRLIAQRRFNMALLVILGVLGLVIAGVGIFGVMAYTVARRTNEIGVRIALGATPRRILTMVLGDATWLIGFGLAVGAVAAWYLTSFAKAFLFQLQPTDPRVFAAALATLALIGFVAALLPARRAAAVDPLRSLRES
jgi:putative ABC transport system permease protein